MTRDEIEIMAPAGSYESLMAAIHAGADSIYFGVEQLNMRARSSNNFTLCDLEKISEIARKHNIKTYLTVNIVIFDNEIGKMIRVVDAAKKHGIDAIIASDMAVIHYARTTGMEVHMSTQVNISNIEAVRFYSQFADVMVLARELNLDQVKDISKGIELLNIKGPSGHPVRLEMFAHGALCMSISGKCYLSLHEQNYSANRGACLQNCRKGYVVTEKESGDELEIDNEYIMSPRDLCTVHFLNKLLDAGVRVLKIEGRARSPEYVKTVVECYNEAVHSMIGGTYTPEKIAGWRERLSTVFNRGFWDGYYLGQRLGEWSEVYGSKATKKKIYIGKVTNYFTNIHVAEILCESGTLEVGDDILLMGPTTGVIETNVEEIRLELKNVNKAAKGDTFSIPVDTFLRRSDKLYKLVEA
jgi:putative protease